MFKRVGRPVIFVIVLVIAVLSYLACAGFGYSQGDNRVTVVKGAQDIRFGIDIKGGVDVTFTPPKGVNVTKDQLDAAVQRLSVRLDNLNIKDRNIYEDYATDSIEIRFPWKSGIKDKDPESAISELGAMSQLTFKDPSGNVLLTGNDVKSAQAKVDASNNNNGYCVSLTFNSAGTTKFAAATKKFLNKQIGIYMDTTEISSPVVQSEIDDGQAIINNTNSPMTAAAAQKLANQINAGALPFKLVTDNYSTISAQMGANALNVTVMAGFVAFILICLFMILYYRLPGLIACIALCGHVAGTLLCISIPQLTLTLPGIAGIILSIGMGVDANVLTGERIKEELRLGKTLDGAIDAGFERSFTAIFDGNVTVFIVGILLMWLGSGTVQSFGYTLIIGVIFNLIMGVTASRLMLKSVSKFEAFRRNFLFGGAAQ